LNAIAYHVARSLREWAVEDHEAVAVIGIQAHFRQHGERVLHRLDKNPVMTLLNYIRWTTTTYWTSVRHHSRGFTICEMNEEIDVMTSKCRCEYG
jgi:hypothetical protein